MAEFYTLPRMMHSISYLRFVLGIGLLATTSLVAQSEFATPPSDAVTSSSGLISVVLEKGTGDRHPIPSDSVAVYYTARKLDGEIFMQSQEVNEPAIFALQNVFPGWREGIQQMVIGEKRRLWIPPGLGAKKEKETVVFDVELVGIRAGVAPPADLLSPPKDSLDLGRGVRMRVLREGRGEGRLTRENAPLFNYSVWTNNGRVIDSTAMRGRPSMMPLHQVMPAFVDCVLGMRIGESRRCWIPGSVAKRQWVGSPRGDLVFDLELVKMMDAETVFPQEGMGQGQPKGPADTDSKGR